MNYARTCNGWESSLLSSSSIPTQIIENTNKVRMKEPLNYTLKARTYRGSCYKSGGWTLQLHTRRRNSPRGITVPCIDETGGRSSLVAISLRSGSLFRLLYLINLLICHFILWPPYIREPFLAFGSSPWKQETILWNVAREVYYVSFSILNTF